MKKNVFFLIAAFCAFSFPAFAAEETLKPGIKTSSSDEELVAMDLSSSRFRELERRLNDTQRELRTQRDSIRSLERDVNDLKRRTGT